MSKLLLKYLPLPMPCSLFLSQGGSLPFGKSFSGYEMSSRSSSSLPRRGPRAAGRAFPAALCRVSSVGTGSSGRGQQGDHL